MLRGAFEQGGGAVDRVSSHRSWFSLISLCFALFTIAFNITGISNMLVSIANEFSADLSSSQWVINSYFLILASSVVIGGQLGNLFGRRKMYLIGLAGFIIGLIVGAFSVATWLLIVSRIILAISSALIVPASLSIINVIFDPESRKTAFSIFGAIIGFGFLAGPLLSGVIVDIFGWRWVFCFSIPLIVMAALVALVAMPESQDKEDNTLIDFGGVLFLGLAIFGIILFLDKSPNWGYSSLPSMMVLGISLICLVVFFWVELRVEKPLIHFMYFKERKFLAVNLAIFSINFSFMGLIYLFNIVFQNSLALNYGALDAGLAMLPMSICFFVVSLFAGKLMDWMGGKKLVIVGMLSIFIGSFYLALMPADVLYVQYVAPLMIFGAGIGFMTGPSQMIALNSVSGKNVGEASGITNMICCIGGAIGVAVTSLIYSVVSKDQLNSLVQHMKLPAIDEQILEGWIVGAKFQSQSVLEKMDPALLSRLLQDVKQALFSGVSVAMFAMGVLCLLTALACFFLIQDKKN